MQWVPKKTINQQRVSELLIQSIQYNQFTNGGPNVAKLESVIREKLAIDDNKAIICTSNGTAALHALTSGLAMSLGHRLYWATQSFTFPASAQGPLHNSKIIDIDDRGGLDLEQIPPDIDGIIVTNVFGNVVDIDQYLEWASTHNKLLIFDNAATMYTKYKDKNALNYGEGCIISFHHTKPLGFAEGGAAIVNKEHEFAIRRCINFGIHNPSGHRWRPEASNYKMSEIAAVYILQYLDNAEKIIQHHHELYTFLKERLKGTGIRMYPNYSESATPFLSCFCLLNERFTPELIETLANHGIQCRKYYRPLINTPMAKQFYDQIICIPCTIDVSKEDLEQLLPQLL